MNKFTRIAKLIGLLLILCLLPVSGLAEIVELPIDFSGGMPFQGKFTLDTWRYEDPSITVERGRIKNQDEGNTYGCAVNYCRIKIASPTQLRTVSVRGFDQKHRAKVAVMARRTNAVVAIDGDFFGARADTYVLRQGILYRDKVAPNQDILLIDEDGDFHVVMAADDPASKDLTTVDGKKVINAFSFGPALIVDNVPVMLETSSPAMSSPYDRAQRMCIAQTGPLEYLVVCVRDYGLTLQQMVTLVDDLTDNVEVAYMMDGGESSQMVFMGYLINKPDRNARDVTDIIYFASAWKPEE